MPFTSTEQAKDAILTVFKTAWDTITPSPPAVIYQGTKKDTPDGDESFVRVWLQHTDGFQSTVGGAGGRRFRAEGSLSFFVHTPLKLDDGGTLAYQYAKVLQDAYEGKSTGGDQVEFRRVRLIEVGTDGTWYRVNVLMDFDYDRIK